MKSNKTRSMGSSISLTTTQPQTNTARRAFVQTAAAENITATRLSKHPRITIDISPSPPLK